MDKLLKLWKNTGPARIFVPFGVIIIVFGIIIAAFDTDDFIEVTGTVTKVEECAPVPDEPQQYDVYFSYTVDGKDYVGEFPNLTEKYEVGGEIKIYCDPNEPLKTTNSKDSKTFGVVLIAAGAAAAAAGVYMTAKAVKKSGELSEGLPGGKFPSELFDGFKSAPGVTEYYCLFDGNSLKPGYIVEDAARKLLYEAKMTKQSLVGARIFEFRNHVTGGTAEHEVGHTAATEFSGEFFSVSSSFKFDGENVWDVLHDKGLRLSADLRGKLPGMAYSVLRGGRPFARIEAAGKYVHEDEAGQHKLNVPSGRYYYRLWTDSNDLDTLFLAVFALSESGQMIVE